MADGKRNCPKCDGEMKVGFLMDMTHQNLTMEIGQQMQWVEGESGEHNAFTGGISLGGKTRRKVVSYCCDSCGYLESYAQLRGTAD